jgi:hypothetical protein
MRLLMALSVTVSSAGIFATNLAAAELTPNVLHLIGPEAWVVTGIDLQRYSTSELHHLFPWDIATKDMRQVIRIGGVHDGGQLTVFVGPQPVEQAGSAFQSTALDPNTTAVGEAGAVQDAIRQWNRSGNPSQLALEARSLSGEYDGWFLLLKPLENFTHNDSAPSSKYVTDLIQVVEQVSGGIRFGSVNELEIDIVTRSASDAASLAALVQWMPGLILLNGPGMQERGLIEAAEDLVVRTNGRMVSISFTLSESRVSMLAKRVQEMWDHRVR